MICGRCGHKIEDSTAVCLRCRLAFPESSVAARRVRLPRKRTMVIRRLLMAAFIGGTAMVLVSKFLLKADMIAMIFTGASGAIGGAAIAFIPKWVLQAYYRMQLANSQHRFDSHLQRAVERYEK